MNLRLKNHPPPLRVAPFGPHPPAAPSPKGKGNGRYLFGRGTEQPEITLFYLHFL